MDLRHSRTLLHYACAFSLFLISSLALSVVHGQTTIPIVKEIRVRDIGSGSINEEFVLSHVSTKAGFELDRFALSRDIKTILDTGFFSYAGAELEPVDDGVILVYVVEGKLKLANPVEVIGVRHFSKSKIQKLMALRKGDFIDEQLVNINLNKVKEKYFEHYYSDVNAQAKIEIVDPSNGLANVILKIDEGKRTRIKSVDIVGNKKVPTSVIRKIVKQPSRWNPFRIFWKRRYDNAEFKAAQSEIRKICIDNGLLDAVVEPLLVTGDPGSDLKLTVRLSEGDQYRIGNLALEGVSIFPEQELKKVITVKTGDVASKSAIDRSSQALRDYYGDRGYMNTGVRLVLVPDKSKQTIDVMFLLAEGQLVKIRNIRIRGNTQTRDKVIRREIVVDPGDVYNARKVRISESRLRNLGFLSEIRTHPENTAVNDVKDLVFEVAEKRSGQFMLGAGFSSIDNIMGFAEISQGNFDIANWPAFTGGGQKLKLSAEMGSKREQYNLSFVEPWFMDRQLSFGVDLYKSYRKYSSYEINKKGLALTITKPLSAFDRISFQYELEKVNEMKDTNVYVYVDVERDGSETLSFDEDDLLKSSFKVSVTRDTRDNPFVSTRGTRASLFSYASGGLLAGDVDIYGMGTRVKHYVPLWFKHVLSLLVRCEVVEAYGDGGQVPYAERLFVGGGNTIRGYDYREVGPKAYRIGDDESRYRPYGGKSLAMASAEYNIRLASKMRFAGFYDIGNVWSEPYEMDFGKLASSAGLGIRLDLPGFPVRVDYAWPLKKDDDVTNQDKWVVWIGYDY